MADLAGLERRTAAGESIDRISSVASFVISRVDSKLDSALEDLGRMDLAGKAEIANAKLAYEAFQRLFSGERWEKLVAEGANRSVRCGRRRARRIPPTPTRCTSTT